METIDDEFLRRRMDFIDRQHRPTSPFFVWHNATRMHVYTHVPESPWARPA
jgi:arylsulfatase A-like enzyme